MAGPLVVVEGSDVAVTHAVREVETAGWTIVAGFSPGPGSPDRVVHVGEVAADADAARAVLCALEGAGLIVIARADREVIDRLVDDLRRLGRVDHRIGDPPRRADIAPEARAILGLLAEGHSLGEAAHILGLARRTADRRVAEARRALGVERTTEAIARARHQGWLRRSPADEM